VLFRGNTELVVELGSRQKSGSCRRLLACGHADPIEHGIVTNWDDMEKIWHHTVSLDLGHLLAVDLGVERRLGEEDRVLFRGNTELVVEHADPIEHGIVTNWDDMEKIWHHTVSLLRRPTTTEGGRVEGLEHDLGHLLAVDLGVERRLGEEDRVLLSGTTP
jgi:hypothetical protein